MCIPVPFPVKNKTMNHELKSPMHITCIQQTGSFSIQIYLIAVNMIQSFLNDCDLWSRNSVSRNKTVYEDVFNKEKKSHVILLNIYYDAGTVLWLYIQCLSTTLGVGSYYYIHIKAEKMEVLKRYLGQTVISRHIWKPPLLITLLYCMWALQHYL